MHLQSPGLLATASQAALHDLPPGRLLAKRKVSGYSSTCIDALPSVTFSELLKMLRTGNRSYRTEVGGVGIAVALVGGAL